MPPSFPPPAPEASAAPADPLNPAPPTATATAAAVPAPAATAAAAAAAVAPASDWRAVAMQIFRFFASLKLALILLAVLIVGLASGTIIESIRNTAFAKAHVYDAWWFSIWLAFLIINLTCAALIRYPWKPHLTGFVITHAGIITMLVGAKVGQITGVEGGMDLHTGSPPATFLEKFDDQWIEVGLPDQGVVHRLPFQVQVDDPSATDPKVYNIPQSDLKIRVLNVRPVDPIDYPIPDSHGDPAVHYRLVTPAGPVQGWLEPGGSDSSAGLVEFHFKRGLPPAFSDVTHAPGPSTIQPLGQPTGQPTGKPGPGQVRSVEHWFFFQNPGMPFLKLKDGQVGPDSGLTGSFSYAEPGGDPAQAQAVLHLTLKGRTFDLPVDHAVGHDLALTDTAYTVHVDRLFRKLNVSGSKAEDNPDPNAPLNPALQVTLWGPYVSGADAKPPADAGADPHAANPHAGVPGMGGMGGPDGPDGMGMPLMGGKSPDQITFYLAPNGALYFDAKSSRSGEQTHRIEPGQVFKLGWAAQMIPGGMQLEVTQFYPHARDLLYFTPESDEKFNPDNVDGVRPGLLCEVSYNGATQQIWLGRQRRNVMLPQVLLMNGKTVNLDFANQRVDLDFGVRLQKFDVPTDQGTNDPSDFRSTLAIGPVHQPDKDETAEIFMNHPTNYPNNGYGAFLGTSYKFSQANHDPSDPGYSGVQVLLDPGWMPKWLGALLIIFGIFTMFYLKPYITGLKASRAEAAANANGAQVVSPEAQATHATAQDILARAKQQRAAAGKSNASANAKNPNSSST
ncbi:MAG: hypothetical protein ACREJ2_00410 [Planctomycetota bacterium]